MLIATMLFGRVFIAEVAIKFFLEQKGLAPVSLTIDRIGVHGSEISSLTIGPNSELYIEGLEVDYTLMALIVGKVKSVSINKGKVSAQIRNDGLSFGVFDELIGISPSDGEQERPSKPNAQYKQDHPETVIQLEFTGDLNSRDDGYVLELNLDCSCQKNLVAGKLRAAFIDGDVVSSSLVLNKGELNIADLVLSFSDAQFYLSKSTKQVITARATIVFDRVVYQSLDQLSKIATLDLESNFTTSKNNSDHLKTNFRLEVGLGTNNSQFLEFSVQTKDVLDKSKTIEMHGEIDVAALGTFPTMGILGENQVSGKVVFDYEALLGEIMAVIDNPSRIPKGSGEVLFELEARDFLSQDSNFGVKGVATVATRQEGLLFETKEALLFPHSVVSGITLKPEGLRFKGTITNFDQMSLHISPFQLVDQSELPVFGSVEIAADTTANSKGASFEGVISETGGQALFNFSGEHLFIGSTGNLVLRSVDLELGDHGLDLTSVLPVLRGSVSDIEGQVKADVSLFWSEEAFNSSAKLELVEIGMQSRVAEIKGINGLLRFNSLNPLNTPPGQKITIKLIDPGIGLHNGSVDFSVKDGVVFIDHGSGLLDVGKVSLKDAVYDFNAQQQEFVVKAENFDLQKFFELLDIDGLTATGTLFGEIPIAINQNEMAIVNGRLTSTQEGGTISYRSTVTESISNTSQSDLLFSVIENFHYSNISVEVDGKLTDKLETKMQIQGSNPVVMEGYPIELNISIEVPVESLTKSLVGYQIPEMIQQRFSIPAQ